MEMDAQQVSAVLYLAVVSYLSIHYSLVSDIVQPWFITRSPQNDCIVRKCGEITCSTANVSSFTIASNEEVKNKTKISPDEIEFPRLLLDTNTACSVRKESPRCSSEARQISKSRGFLPPALELWGFLAKENEEPSLIGNVHLPSFFSIRVPFKLESREVPLRLTIIMFSLHNLPSSVWMLVPLQRRLT
jgi:hypothetical protein